MIANRAIEKFDWAKTRMMPAKLWIDVVRKEQSDLPFVVCSAICLAAALLPVATFSIPPLVDYPAHLARQYIIHDLLTARHFSSMYELHFAVIPNLGMEIIVLPLLLAGVPIEIAGRLYLALIVVLLGVGVMAVQRDLFGKASALSLLGFAYIYNPVFMYGFANYVLGLALALIGFSWWLRMRDRSGLAMVPLALLWCTALFLCHLTSVFLFLGMIGAYELSTSLISKGGPHGFASLFRAMKLFSVPVAVILLLYHLGPFGSERTPPPQSFGPLGEIPQRIRALPSYLTAYSRLVDVISLVWIAMFLIAGFWLRKVRVAWPMLLAVAGLIIVYLVVPDTWSGTDYIAYRIPMAVFFLLVSSLGMDSDRRGLFCAIVTALVILRTSAVVSAWYDANVAYKPMMAALDKLHPGSALVAGVNYGGSFEPQLRLPWSHFGSYATMRREAFVADVFADHAQNWIVPTSKYGALARSRPLNNRIDTHRTPAPGHDMFDPVVVRNFDFLLAVRPDLYQGKTPHTLKEVARSARTVLFSLHPSSETAERAPATVNKAEQKLGDPTRLFSHPNFVPRAISIGTGRFPNAGAKFTLRCNKPRNSASKC